MSAIEPTFQKLDDFGALAAQSRYLLDHWKSLREEGQVPLWASFDPLDVSEALSICAILEFAGTNQANVRLFGISLVERFGTDITGTNYFDAFEPGHRPEIIERVSLLRSRPAIVRTIVAAQTPMEVPMIVESIFYPFRENDGSIDRALLSIYVLSADEYVLPLPFQRAPPGTRLQVDIVDL